MVVVAGLTIPVKIGQQAQFLVKMLELTARPGLERRRHLAHGKGGQEDLAFYKEQPARSRAHVLPLIVYRNFVYAPTTDYLER
jgi:hypothetical protein